MTRGAATHGAAVQLYLRPEEIGVHVNGAVAARTRCPAKVAKVEFLGAFCLVGIALDGDDMPPLIANVSRQTADAPTSSPAARSA